VPYDGAMAGNPREHVKGKGFWDGGSAGRSSNGQTGGRPSGFPGRRSPKRVGVKTDIEFPDTKSAGDDPSAGTSET
jgi:hypothetical protein